MLLLILMLNFVELFASNGDKILKELGEKQYLTIVGKINN